MNRRLELLPKTITNQQRTAILGYVKKGYSANKIQVKLRERNIGIRRKSLLSEIRKIRHQEAKTEVVKYIPKRYVKARWTARTEAIPRERLRPFTHIRAKQVAVYGSAQTSVYDSPYSARFEFYGSGRDIREAIQKVISEGWVPHRKHAFVTVSARAFLNNPEAYGKQAWWARKPDVRS